MPATPIDGFTGPESFEAAGITLPIYQSEEGTRPLILMHELPGMTPPFLDYCRRMAGKDFKVIAPLLFKSPGKKMSNGEMARFCISREFSRLFGNPLKGGGARGITSWLLALIDKVRGDHPDQNIGVIGMCLTGGFALAGIARPGVSAAIACQPAMPLVFGRRSLALSATERENAAQRARTLPSPCLKAYRYAGDTQSKPAHIDGAKALFGESFAYHELPGDGHSTVTREPADEAVVEDILTFLNDRL